MARGTYCSRARAGDLRSGVRPGLDSGRRARPRGNDRGNSGGGPPAPTNSGAGPAACHDAGLLALFRRLALLGAILATTVVVLGARVRAPHAGLGCPDWPGCYGHLYPQAAHETCGPGTR